MKDGGRARHQQGIMVVRGREAMALVGARFDYRMRRVLAQPCAMRAHYRRGRPLMLTADHGPAVSGYVQLWFACDAMTKHRMEQLGDAIAASVGRIGERFTIAKCRGSEEDATGANEGAWSSATICVVGGAKRHVCKVLADRRVRTMS